MKHLLLLRHAKSNWGDAALSDFDRPLAPRGERDAPRIGAALRERSPQPDHILSSTARRARQTTELIVRAAGLTPEPQYLPTLYAASVQTLLAIVRRIPPASQCTLLIGHNTSLEELLGQLTGEGRHMPTTALACIALDVARWEDAEENIGTLLWFLTPADLTGSEA